MFRRNNKGKLGLGLFLSLLGVVLSVGYVDASKFTDMMLQVGLDPVSFSSKNAVSRYEVSRLLNLVNCEDCIHAPNWMIETYSQTFWNAFKEIDGKDFDDISYKGAVWNKKSYYYCVAYVGDNGYMAGYPSTSTKCQGNFCGQENVSVSEVYQTILNIVQNQIMQHYTVDWKAVKSRLKGLKRNGIELKVLNIVDVNAINNADVNLNKAQSNYEFQAWLKYCMYNLSGCDFQTFGKIGQAYWPVSELNILYKERIISYEDAMKVAESNSSINGEDALRIFSTVFENFSNCTFNLDYDCDEVLNWSDNCPYAYNPNQYDLDGDGVGNVCDDDVDGDGNKNQIGIVDDNNHIVISLLDSNSDQTPLGNQDVGFGFFINVDAISSGYPVSVRFNPLTNGNIRKIEWDFGDGTTQVSSGVNKVKHVYQSAGNFMTHSIGDAGNFIVRAIATSNDGSQAFAMTKIFIANPSIESYGLNISPKFSFKNGHVNYEFTPLYSGDIDLVSRSVNNGGGQVKGISENYNISTESNGTYVVYAKGYKGGEMKSVSMFNIIQQGSPSYATMNVNVGTLGNPTSISTNLVGILKKDIDYISIDWGGEVTSSFNLAQSHVYDQAGLKTIQQSVVLKDGTIYYSVATVTIQNSLLTQSYAINVSGSRFTYNQNENLSLGLSLYPIAPVLSLFTSYQPGYRTTVYNPNLAQTILDYAYSTAGDKLLTNSVEVNRCVDLINQGTVHINAADVCEAARKQGTLSQLKCDMDGDNIPDICDDDIDGDGFKNLLGIITHENQDCSITVDNVNVEILRKQFGVCSLDNSPFVENPNQSDLNNNKIGDAGESAIIELLNQFGGITSSQGSASVIDYDSDQDGIPDSIDQCVDVPGNSVTGCPKVNLQECWAFSTCGNGEVDEGETCLNCPWDAGECCGNGILDPRETCETCPVDGGTCGLCGNGVIDEGENCQNCPIDVGECTAFCGNGIIEMAENCRNCPEDVGECTAFCGNGKIEVAEDCHNCPKDVSQCRSTTCGNNRVETNVGEECDNGKNNGKDGKCTLMCTRYNPRKPDCGNGVIDDGEDCKTCSVDLGEKCVAGGETIGCGNGVIDDGETCLNCPVDVGICTAFCGNGIIEIAEDCLNCPEDVGECTAFCGNGKIEIAEDCENCLKDVKQCRSNTCGNGRVEANAGEECDNGDNNGKDQQCTLMCTRYNPNNPTCGNGVIDNGEDCQNCSVDLGEKCVIGGDRDKCGNGVIDKGEDCKNCPEDVGVCTAFCGNGVIEDAENCRNCPEDVGECTAFCGNGKIEIAEDCENCSKDVKQCRSDTCGNSKVERESGEQCDNGENNGKDGKCTVMCTKYNPSNPTCGNGRIDDGEVCQNCPVDLGEKCVTGGDRNKCGNGVIDEGENCKNCLDDVGECTAFCGNGKVEIAEDCNTCPEDAKQCRSKICGNKIIETSMGEQCDNGENNGKDGKCTKMCTNYDSNNPTCGNGRYDTGEDCQNCSIDLGVICIDDGDQDPEDCGNGMIDQGERCEDCQLDLQDICIDDGDQDPDPEDCGNRLIDQGERCEKCSEDLRDICIDLGEKEICGDGVVGQRENCNNCEEDLNTCIQYCGDGEYNTGETCNNCPTDLGECPNSCGNGVIETPEECDNGVNNGYDGICSETCKGLKQYCGNGKREFGEQCDNGENNGKDGKCTVACTNYDSNNPKCGNGEYDEGEDCNTCPIDLKNACIGMCGDGVINPGEQCDNGKNNGKDGKCTFECKIEPDPTVYCGNNIVEITKGEECDLGIRNGIDITCNSNCRRIDSNPICGDGILGGQEECDYGSRNGEEGINCDKKCKEKKKCGNLKIDEGETCITCPEDLGNKCEPPVPPICKDGIVSEGENCNNCEEDLKRCVPDCGDGQYNPGETCNNCPTDLGACPNSCGNGVIEAPEECDNGVNNGYDGICSNICKSLVHYCGNGEKEGTEECDEGELNGVNNGEGSCTVACTYFDPDDPDCGNGEYNEGEDCTTCSIDLGNACIGMCGDGAINPGEQCDNGENNGHDGKCTFECKIEEDPTVYCGNNIVEITKGEECDLGIRNGIDITCNKDCRKMDPNPKCGDGILGGQEECDYGSRNGEEGINCNTNCKENKCGNLEKDEGENCETCPEDLGDKCKGGPRCGDGIVSEGENCNNCEPDLKTCIQYCGDGEYNPGETCNNCPKDLGACPNSCGNGVIEIPEECDNGVNNGYDGVCSNICTSLEQYCGNGKVEGTEECDNGKNNGKDGKCTVVCTNYDPNNPTCGNGEYDEGEDCNTCPIDLKNACIGMCGDGAINPGEQCDNGENNGHDGKCTFECKIEEDPTVYCGNNIVEITKGEECDLGIRNGIGTSCTSNCRKIDLNPKCGDGILGGNEECDYGKELNGKDGINCDKKCKEKKKCGNLEKDEGEDCITCPEDLGDKCESIIPKCGNGVVEGEEECDYGDSNGEEGVDCNIKCKKRTEDCGNGTINEGEDCENCPEDLKDICLAPGVTPLCEEDSLCWENPLCGNGVIDQGETCENCPQDFGWCIQNNSCNMCPCEYADFFNDLTAGDFVRAKLWDRAFSVFYNYSNAVNVENYLNIK